MSKPHLRRHVGIVLAVLLTVFVRPCRAQVIDWVAIDGGQFSMGTDEGSQFFKVARPAHKVRIRTFDMSRTLVTVKQYADCWIRDSKQCTEPATGGNCNWKRKDRLDHPINCVTWEQASAYAKSVRARLPTEAEWEYAAKSGGKDQKYPWGNEAAGCERAVMMSDNVAGCGSGGTMPVCSKPAGNTAQGLCDMAGNVEEWVEDRVTNSYDATPVDGSAFEGDAPEAGQGVFRDLRGGCHAFPDPQNLRADYRHGCQHTCNYDFIGFRVARDHRGSRRSTQP